MKQTNNIEQFDKKQSFIVPENYFSKLKSDIQFKTENLESKIGFKNYLSIKTIVPVLASVFLLLITFNYVKTFDPKSDNVLSEEIYTEFVEFEIENIDEEYLFEFLPDEEYAFSDEIEYLIDNNTDYNLIIK
jgi:hypothetical protein